MIMLNGVTRAERHETIQQVSELLSRQDAWIEDTIFFSNVAVTLRCVAPARACALLAEGLQDLNLGIPQAEFEALRLAGDEGEELVVALSLTFVHSDPDLRSHVPSVPG